MKEITLATGMRNNLLSLKENSRNTDITQERLATGKRVNSPLDNPTNFFAAKALGAQAADLEALRERVHEGIGTMQATAKGLEGVVSLLQTMGGIVDAAAMTSNAAEKAALASSFDEVYAQLNYLVQDSGYGGTNLLSNTSADPRSVTSEDLEIPLNASGEASYTVSGRFMGSGYVLHETPGGDPSWIPQPAGDAIYEYGSETSVGNLSDVSLVIRFNPQFDSPGDVNNDGVLQAGEGTEIDFRLTNNGTSMASNVSFDNATTSTGWNFLINDGSPLGNVLAGQTVITDSGTDLDLAIPAGTNGTEFSISLDFTSDGVTKRLTFGPLTVGSITNGQTLSPSSVSSVSGPVMVQTDGITVNSADYSSGTFGVTLSGPPVVAKTFYAEKQGLEIYHSWLYGGFASSSGINAARTDIDNSISAVRSYAAEIGSHSATLVTRGDFNESLASVFRTGADNLTLADMNEEGAKMLMLQTRQNLSVQSLSLASQASEGILKVFA